MPRANKIKIGISAFLLLFSVSWVVRTMPFNPYHPLGGNFFINGFYGIIYTIQNHHMFQTGELSISSNFARGIYTGSADLGFTIANSILLTVLSNKKSVTELALLNRNIPWVGLFVFPMSQVALINAVPGNRSYWEYSIVLLASLLGSWQVIYLSNSGSSNAPVGWAMILLTLYAIIRIQQTNSQRRYYAISLLSSFVIIVYYHTASVVFLIILTIIFIGNFIAEGQEHSPLLMLVYGVGFIWWFMNMSTAYFTTYASKVIFLVQTIISLDLAYGSSPTAINYAYESPINLPTFYKVLSVGSKFAITLLFSLMGLILIHKYISEKRIHPSHWCPADRQLILYLIAVPFVGLFILQAHGIGEAISRTFQYGFISIGILLVTVNRTVSQDWDSPQVFRIVATVLVLTGAVFSTGLFLGTPARGAGLIEEDEYSSAEFVTTHGEDGNVWTDYRLFGALLANHHYQISGLWPKGEDTTAKTFESTYYTTNGSAAVSSMRSLSDTDVSYLLLSENMMNKKQGINANGIRFENMTVEEYMKYNRTKSLCKITDSGDGEIYKMDCQG